MIDHRQLFSAEDLEVALTRNVVLELARRGSPFVVGYPRGTEATHGADLELWIRSRGFRVGFRLQAKALKPLRRSAGTYEELGHRIGGQADGPRQIDILIDETRKPLNPAYLFYNGLEHEPPVRSACCRDDEWSPRNGQLGITFASARRIRELLDGPRAFPKRLEAVLPRSYPLPCAATCVDVSHIVPPGLSWPLEPITDFLSRMPGWILDAGVGTDPLWVVAEDGSISGTAALETLHQLGWDVRATSPVSTAYVESLLEAGEFSGLEDRFDMRPAWPVVVLDLEREVAG